MPRNQGHLIWHKVRLRRRTTRTWWCCNDVLGFLQRLKVSRATKCEYLRCSCSILDTEGVSPPAALRSHNSWSAVVSRVFFFANQDIVIEGMSLRLTRKGLKYAKKKKKKKEEKKALGLTQSWSSFVRNAISLSMPPFHSVPDQTRAP